MFCVNLYSDGNFPYNVEVICLIMQTYISTRLYNGWIYLTFDIVSKYTILIFSVETYRYDPTYDRIGRCAKMHNLYYWNGNEKVVLCQSYF